MKRIILVIIAVFLLSGCGQTTRTVSISVEPESVDEEGLATSSQENKPATQVTEEAETSKIEESEEPLNATINEESKTVEVPAKLELPVLFAQQAPFANWDEVHEETCEEASMIMVARYFKGQPLTETIMEEELQKILKWQEERGYKVDATAGETIQILKDYFKLEARLSEEVTADRIKYELSQGNLIIVPAAGRELKNPNFKQPGPIYHMLVVKGYNDREFITNDPGTRKGNGYKYSYETLLGATHDWDHELAKDGMTDAEMAQGRKIMIIVEKI